MRRIMAVIFAVSFMSSFTVSTPPDAVSANPIQSSVSIFYAMALGVPSDSFTRPSIQSTSVTWRILGSLGSMARSVAGELSLRRAIVSAVATLVVYGVVFALEGGAPLTLAGISAGGPAGFVCYFLYRV